MFHGQPYCTSCGYKGPDFMWMWHHWWGFDVLVQHVESLSLRTVKIPDSEVFYHRDGRSEAEVARESQEYVTEIVSRELRPGERHVQVSEFVNLSEAADSSRTELRCPECRDLLYWRDTGIS